MIYSTIYVKIYLEFVTNICIIDYNSENIPCGILASEEKTGKYDGTQEFKEDAICPDKVHRQIKI